MFMFDVETLGVESNSVILSATIVHFDTTNKPDYKHLLANACFVKFNAKEQVKIYKRTMDNDTMNWWNTQHDYIKQISFFPKKDDLSVNDGLTQLKEYIDKYDPDRKQTIWARGNLDQMIIASLCRQAGFDALSPHYLWRDVRTAVDLLTGSSNGYCNVNYDGFTRDEVIKHHPTHDCAYDCMQLLYGTPTTDK